MTFDETMMHEALQEARAARQENELPVGCVITYEGKIIARAHNEREQSHDPTAHAEVVAIRRAAKHLNQWRLNGCTIYVTLEPCPMSAGAIANARVERVVFGAYDPKAGAYGSVFDLNALPLNHHPAVVGGCLEPECRSVLTSYFRAKRKKETL